MWIESKSKLDWANPHTVGGLKWIDLDRKSTGDGRGGFCHVTHLSLVPVTLFEMATGPWSTEETRALLDVWGADNIQHHLDGIVRNRVIYQKVVSREQMTQLVNNQNNPIS